MRRAGGATGLSAVPPIGPIVGGTAVIGTRVSVAGTGPPLGSASGKGRRPWSVDGWRGGRDRRIWFHRRLGDNPRTWA